MLPMFPEVQKWYWQPRWLKSSLSSSPSEIEDKPCCQCSLEWGNGPGNPVGQRALLANQALVHFSYVDTHQSHGSSSSPLGLEEDYGPDKCLCYSSTWQSNYRMSDPIRYFSWDKLART